MTLKQHAGGKILQISVLVLVTWVGVCGEEGSRQTKSCPDGSCGGDNA
jgi:hypothetical protein